MLRLVLTLPLLQVDDMKAKQNMKWVDSDILHPGLLQRYTKEEFFRIFRAHLEKETAPLRAQQEEESSILLEKLKRGEPVTKRARVKLPRRAKTPKARSTSPQRLASRPRVSFASEGKRPRSTSAHSARSTSRSTTRQHHHAYLNTEEALQQVPKIQGFKPNYEDDHDVSTHFPPQRRPVRQQLIADERVRVSHDEYLERKHGPKGIDYEKQRELVRGCFHCDMLSNVNNLPMFPRWVRLWRFGMKVCSAGGLAKSPVCRTTGNLNVIMWLHMHHPCTMPCSDFRVEYRNNKTTVHALHLVKWK